MSTISTANKKTISGTQFYQDTLAGLRSSPKFMQSKYFYDDRGSFLFQQIMNLEEYYLTDAEMEIFTQQADQISRMISARCDTFDLIELGAGDATKSIHLLRELLSLGQEFSYFPIDISEDVIRHLEKTLPKQLPALQITGLNGDYFEMLKKATALSDRRKVVLFMGANIGNMSPEDAGLFCRELRNSLSKHDIVIMGFDLKKNPQQILSAYNDHEGVTREFNLNLLKRINRELGGDFDLNGFEHYASYDPESGACKSYLISLKDQTVHIGNSEPIHFSENEYIFMEISQKYSLNEIDAFARTSGFKPIHHFFDRKRFFIDAIWDVE